MRFSFSLALLLAAVASPALASVEQMPREVYERDYLTAVARELIARRIDMPRYPTGYAGLLPSHVKRILDGPITFRPQFPWEIPGACGAGRFACGR